MPETVSTTAADADAIRPTPPAATTAQADAPVEPAATPLLDAALRRAEAAEASQREAIREAQAAIRQPVAEPAPAADPEPTPTPEPTPAPEPTGIEIKATVAPPTGEPAPAPIPEATEPSAESPRFDPAVQPAAAQVEVESEGPDTGTPTAAELPEETPTRPTPPAPTAAHPEPPPEIPTLPGPLADEGGDDEVSQDGATAEPLLTIEAVRLCRKILDFGSYEPLASSTLRPGRSALVYCELGGLEYRPDGDDFVAKIATRVELVRPEDGQKAWEVSDGAVDRRPARRRDVYVGTMITLPDSIAPGEYTLRLYQADSTSGRTASAEIPVTIAR